MGFQLTNDKIQTVNRMLSEGMKLRAIARKFGISESLLRWRLAKAGLETQFTGRLVPIHAPTIDSTQSAMLGTPEQ